MPILRYTCTACGLVTRAEPDQEYRACVCKAEYVIINEDEEAAALDEEAAALAE